MQRPMWLGIGGILVAMIMVASLSLFGGNVFMGAAQMGTPEAEHECPPEAADGTPGAMATPAAEHCLELELDTFYFEPNLITVPADESVTFELHNEADIEHNFSITEHGNDGLENLGISVDVAPGETETTTISAPAGEYYFFCDEPGHEGAGMFGYLKVEAGAEVSGEEATVTPRAES